MNIAVLAGTLSSDPVVRTLPSGDELSVLQLTTTGPNLPTRTVPVRAATRTAADRWRAGDEVVVVGSIERRYFRAGGRVASATEVVADSVISASNRKGVTKAFVALERQLAERQWSGRDRAGR